MPETLGGMPLAAVALLAMGAVLAFLLILLCMAAIGVLRRLDVVIDLLGRADERAQLEIMARGPQRSVRPND
jgi:hypothetical protein